MDIDYENLSEQPKDLFAQLYPKRPFVPLVPITNRMYVKISCGTVVDMPSSFAEESEYIRDFTALLNEHQSSEKQAGDNAPRRDPCGTLVNPFPLPSVSWPVLHKVDVWLQDHVFHYAHWRTLPRISIGKNEENELPWKGLTEQTVSFLNCSEFFELARTAEFLKMRTLILACVKFGALMMKNCTADELCVGMRLKQDLQPSREDEIVDRVLRMQLLHGQTAEDSGGGPGEQAAAGGPPVAGAVNDMAE